MTALRASNSEGIQACHIGLTEVVEGDWPFGGIGQERYSANNIYDSIPGRFLNRPASPQKDAIVRL